MQHDQNDVQVQSNYMGIFSLEIRASTWAYADEASKYNIVPH
jgi:hypothetical protein